MSSLLTSQTTNTNQHQCHICNKIFSNRNNLKIHIQTIHHKILPFKCSYPGCNKNYPNNSRYEVHMRTHLGIKPFKCSLCDKQFNESGNLKAHYLKHETTRKFTCSFCEKAYKSKGHLKEHVDIVHKQLR